MILEFCATNFLSIKDELKLSFIATSLKECLSKTRKETVRFENFCKFTSYLSKF